MSAERRFYVRAITRGRPRSVTAGVLQPGAWQGVSGPATRRRRYVRGLRDRLPGCDAEDFGMSPAVVLRQDLTEVARPVRDGAVADLAAGDR